MSNHWLNELQMWTNDFDYIITSTEEQAMTLACETYGYGRDDVEEMEWYIMADEGRFRFQHEDGTIEDKPVSYWIKQHGEGYFACSEC